MRKSPPVIAGLTAITIFTAACGATTHNKPATLPVFTPNSPTASPPASIYTYLPFNQRQFNAAVLSASNAAQDYETFSYRDTSQSYGQRIGKYVTPEYLSALQGMFANSTATAARIKAKEVSTATGQVVSLATFGPTSITFIVSITQKDPITNDSGQYRVTVQTTDGNDWLVNDIEPASAGNE